MKIDYVPEAKEQSEVERILSRPPAERVREFKYRFAQALVFGLPVLALHWFGPRLGGAEALRWTGLFQTLLAGWVLYVAGAGMISEGVMLLARGRVAADFFVSLTVVILYVISVGAWVILLMARGGQPPMLFHYTVLVLIVWCGARCVWLSRAARSG